MASVVSDNGGSSNAAPTYLWAKLIPEGWFIAGYGYNRGGSNGTGHGYNFNYGCGLGYGWLDGNGGNLDG
jgi:hypothetical protein